MSTTLSFDSVRFAQRLKAAQVPEAQIQAETQALREAFDARDKDAQAQAATLHALQNVVQKLQQTQVCRDAEYATTREGALDLGYQVKALEENARREAVERASKRDVDLLRKDTEVGFAKMEVRFTEAKAETALLRKDMEAMENRMVTRLTKVMIAIVGVVAATVGGIAAVLRMLPS